MLEPHNELRRANMGSSLTWEITSALASMSHTTQTATKEF